LDLVINNLPLLIKGLINTLLLSICCLILSLVIGIIVGSLRTVPQLVVVWLTKIYIDVFRGLPVIVTLFLIFFILPILGVNINTFLSATVGLSLWASANVAETVRGAIQSIPPTQTEASYSLGLNYTQTMRYVILPQATRRMLPSVIGLLTNLIQATSLTVLIGNQELLQSAQLVIERKEIIDGVSVAFFFYVIVMAGYFGLCYPLSRWSKKLEKNLNLGS
jgi:polar amino acid transport system permease protein